MSKKMRVYIAGPMTGYPSFNWPNFDRAAADLDRAGFAPVNPVQMDAAFGYFGGEEWTEELAISVMLAEFDAIARHCDAVLLLDGWRASKGATAEVAWANVWGIPVFEKLSALVEFRELQKAKVHHAPAVD